MSVGVERYAMGYSDPRFVYSSVPMPFWRYGDAHKLKPKWSSPRMSRKKVDDHKYETEAKNMSIEACVSFWLIKYGDGPIPAIDTAEQDKLTWEIGNRLWWANRLMHNKPEDTYEIID